MFPISRRPFTLAFPVIGNYFAWKEEDGYQVKVGSDVVVGCKINIFLPGNLFQHLQHIGRCTLILVQNPLDTTLWNQGWLKAHEICWVVKSS